MKTKNELIAIILESFRPIEDVVDVSQSIIGVNFDQIPKDVVENIRVLLIKLAKKKREHFAISCVRKFSVEELTKIAKFLTTDVGKKWSYFSLDVMEDYQKDTDLAEYIDEVNTLLNDRRVVETQLRHIDEDIEDAENNEYYDDQNEWTDDS